jgi:hypothetical protein
VRGLIDEVLKKYRRQLEEAVACGDVLIRSLSKMSADPTFGVMTVKRTIRRSFDVALLRAADRSDSLAARDPLLREVVAAHEQIRLPGQTGAHDNTAGPVSKPSPDGAPYGLLVDDPTVCPPDR